MGWSLPITTIINLNLARFLNITITTKLVNCTRTESKIPKNMSFTMWLSGLRGAMAYALALKCATDLEIGPVILIDTLIYALITILGIGSILNPVLTKLGVKRKDVLELHEQQSSSNSCAQRLKEKFVNWNNRSFAPIFVNMSL